MSRSKTTRPGYVRIIAGTWRGRRIAVPAGLDLRPTPDRVRETLFNWLGPVLPGAVCLDLFAGSGVLGFEALSRGASRAVLVEREQRAAAALEARQQELDAAARIICGDAIESLDKGLGGPFDIVFVDPPFADAVLPVLDVLPQVLKPGARVYLERDRGLPWPEHAGFHWSRRATAGGVAFGLAVTKHNDSV